MRQSKRKSRTGLIVVLSFLVLVIVAGVGCGFYYTSNLKPVGDGSHQVSFEINEGESFDTVLSNLESQKLIKSKTVAQLYTKISGSPAYYAGKFALHDGMSTQEVLAYVGDISNATQEQVSITVPEGQWAKEIAKKISEVFPYTEEEILATWNDSSYLETLAKDYSFLDVNALNNENYKVKLEGYLFPETYMMNADASIDEITRTFLSHFDTVYQQNKAKFDASGMSVHEIITLASVVQFEASSPNDMATIAGIFFNRMNSGMRLESSVTVCYALYDDFNDPKDCEVETTIESPYNTYLNDGLPVGPILNPGIEAINAVLSPQESDYLFFVADIYGDGQVYYSRTFDEHQQRMVELNLVY